jgi:peptide-methionine (S)-S-oxide reductase
MMSMAEDVKPTVETATFAGGCFWCMQPPFDRLEGVVSTQPGYTGGTVPNPTYEKISTGTTGHYEAIEVKYDPAKVSYEKLLETFWKNIDPTNADGQFCDIGSQYRTAIFYHNDAQKQAAEKSKNQLDILAPVVTVIVKATDFYPSEDYHKDYYLKNTAKYKAYAAACGRERKLKMLWSK